MTIRPTRWMEALALALLLGAPANAIPVSVTHTDLPTCDPLIVPPGVDELGDTPVFMGADEGITAVDLPAVGVACPSADSPAPNTLVSMTNMTSRDFVEVWYVADPETSIGNADGLVEDEEAFRIDTMGINTPLVSESLTPDGIFESGETWDFVIDDYFNALGLGADDFFSPGAVGGMSPGGPSSGSIIAIVPEPSTPLLMAAGLAGLGARRRKQRIR